MDYRLLTLLLFTLCSGDPIKKAERAKSVRIPRVNHGLIPIPPIANPPVLAGARQSSFGQINAPVLFQSGRQRELRDQVCDSQALTGCKERCISMKANCQCATNGKTYRNSCELSCMRKVLMEKINWLHSGACTLACSASRTSEYRSMVVDLLHTFYLREKVKRCGKITNCAQAKLVLKFTKGNESITECPKALPTFWLFSGKDCSSTTNVMLSRVFNGEGVIQCKSSGNVMNKLLHDKNCAKNRKGADLRELVQWSFDHLDTNYDRHIKEDELNDLELIPDQECGETFFSTCDLDHDGMIREDEWSMCLGCTDCYRPCFVYQAKREIRDRKRRFIKSITKCGNDGYCENTQCERQNYRFLQCWCVNRDCGEIDGTRTYSRRSCK